MLLSPLYVFFCLYVIFEYFLFWKAIHPIDLFLLMLFVHDWVPLHNMVMLHIRFFQKNGQTNVSSFFSSSSYPFIFLEGIFSVIHWEKSLTAWWRNDRWSVLPYTHQQLSSSRSYATLSSAKNNTLKYLNIPKYDFF